MKELDIVKTMLFIINEHTDNLARLEELSKYDDYSLTKEIKPFVMEIIKAVEKLDQHADSACEQWHGFAELLNVEELKVHKLEKQRNALKRGMKRVTHKLKSWEK